MLMQWFDSISVANWERSDTVLLCSGNVIFLWSMASFRIQVLSRSPVGEGIPILSHLLVIRNLGEHLTRSLMTALISSLCFSMSCLEMPSSISSCVSSRQMSTSSVSCTDIVSAHAGRS